MQYPPTAAIIEFRTFFTVRRGKHFGKDKEAAKRQEKYAKNISHGGRLHNPRFWDFFVPLVLGRWSLLVRTSKRQEYRATGALWLIPPYQPVNRSVCLSVKSVNYGSNCLSPTKRDEHLSENAIIPEKRQRKGEILRGPSRLISLNLALSRLRKDFLFFFDQRGLVLPKKAKATGAGPKIGPIHLSETFSVELSARNSQACRPI